jgi:hypothetical protein
VIVHSAEEPIALALVFGLLVALCRWAFAPTRRHARTPEPPAEPDFGLLVPVLRTRSGELVAERRQELRAAGVSATLGLRPGPDGPEHLLLVFPRDAERAARVLAGRNEPEPG